MELKFEVRLNEDEIKTAIAAYAAMFLPVVTGYHIEVDRTYSFEARASLVKDAEEVEK